ncbi:MAG: rhomboid family intramembrane serine protease [Crocinitomicaceae bacterium]
MLQSLFRNIPPVTKNLLIINFLLYLATMVLNSRGIDLTQLLGLHYFLSDGFYPHQLVTYMFMHSTVDFTHILFNMFAVFMFGKTLEQFWGSKRFLIYYMVTGIGAGLIQMLVAQIRIMPFYEIFSPEEFEYIVTEGFEIISQGKNYVDSNMGQLNGLYNGLTVGASGSVFGILLAFGWLFPNTELMLLFPPIPLKAKWFVMIYGGIELYLGFANNPNDNIAHFAHLGGMLFGFILLYLWKKDRSNFY